MSKVVIGITKSTLLILTSFLLMLPSCVGQKQSKPFGTTSKKAFALFGEALLAHDVRDEDKALVLLEKALKKDKNYLDALNLKGEILMNRGEYDAAKTAFRRILQLKPDHIYALSDLADVHFVLDEYDQCLNLLNRMLPLVGMSDRRIQVQHRIASANFAKNAIQNPVPFKPENMGPVINTVEEEYFPGLSTDENQLFFTRRDGRVDIYRQNEDIFTSFKSGESWSPSENLGSPVNTQENEGAFSASPDGRYLLFTSCARKGGVGRCDLWITRREGDTWMEPQNLGRPVNTVEWESQPSLAADGITLYFVSNRPDGYGGSDIWSSTRTSSGWTEPENLGPKINTKGDEQFPFIHNDGKTLYFTSTGLPGMGKSDIFFTRLVNNKWTEPTNLGYPINTHGDEWNFIVNRTGDKAYFASNGVKPSFGGMDIYSMDLYEAARPSATGYVKGIVFDVDTKRKLGSSIELYDLETGEQSAQTYSDDKTGEFLIALESNSNYALEARTIGYLFHSENFALQNSTLEEPFVLEIGLKKIEEGQPLVLKNVFFDVDKWDLKKESNVELNIAVEFLENNERVAVEIGGHTDNTGLALANDILSGKRARSVYQYLVNAGIDATRLSYKGYGSSIPVGTNDTPEGRAMNRRTEMKIVRK